MEFIVENYLKSSDNLIEDVKGVGWRFLPCRLLPVLVEEMFCEHKIDIPMFVMVILKRTYQKVIVFFLNQTQKQPSTFWLLSIKMAILSFITEIQYTYQEHFFDLVAYS